MIGTLLRGRYRLEAMLGEGAMGQVWRAQDTQLGRQVAVKLFSPALLARPDALARCEREARVSAALGHPNLVRTFDFGEHAGSWFLVMQLISGGNLHAYLGRHAPLTPAAILAFGAQLADAFTALHAHGAVHRDLKPENVLIEGDAAAPQLRVADFGLAYMTAPIDHRQGRLTADGLLGGTPEYMAPEQVAGGAVGPAADIYALGCVLFELATGHTPFAGAGAAGGLGPIFAAHLYAPPPRLVRLRGDLPAGFDELVQRMLAKPAGERPTADAVRRRLATMTAVDAPGQARFGGVVSDRAQRMVDPAADAAAAPVVASPGARVELISREPLPRELAIALTASGVHVVEAAGDVRVVLGGSLEEIARACLAGVPVIADAPRGDFARIAGLLRLDVADVVSAPIAPTHLVRSVLRVLRKRPENRS